MITKQLVIQDADTLKYYTNDSVHGEEYAWTKEIRDAKRFFSITEFEDYVKDLRDKDNYCPDYLEGKTIIPVIAYEIAEVEY